MPTEKCQIKATSNILNLLGSELIGSDTLAIFELVKNSYDADADNVTISFNDLNTEKQCIVIEDDGNGMTTNIVRNVWLTIGTNYKKKEAKISPKYKRHSLGNKGVGRLAIHKLAQSVLLETKTQDDLFGTNVEIDWKDLMSSGRYIEELFVDVNVGVQKEFTRGQGTRITLRGLKNKNWTKKNLRDLVRKIELIKDPFDPIDNFNVTVLCNDDKSEWISDINTGEEIIKNCLYRFEFSVSPSTECDFALFDWKYTFTPHKFQELTDNSVKSPENESYLSIDSKKFEDIDETLKEKHYLPSSSLNGIGKISGVFHVYNLQGTLADHVFGTGKRSAIKDFLKENCGIKVFRDKIRVYNYGEPADDWVGLDLIKIKRAGDHFGKKVTIGAISLDLNSSEESLIEKTNREGFTENDTYWMFQEIVRAVFSHFERIASEDKKKIDAIFEGITASKRIGFSDTINELKDKIEKKNLTQEFSPLIQRVEKDYNNMRDVMLSSGMTGLNIGLVFHEVEREMRLLSTDLDADIDKLNVDALKGRIKNLNLLIENFSPILKQNEKRKLTAYKLVERISQINQSRFRYHNILFSSPLLSKENDDFTIDGPGNLLVSSLNNIIDNAIYWVSDCHELKGDSHKSAIYIGTDINSYDGPAIIIADTGNGFKLEPEDMVLPFKTLKEGGMGLGLYFVNLVMESIGGKLIFPDSKDLNIPEVYNGACVALIFSKK